MIRFILPILATEGKEVTSTWRAPQVPRASKNTKTLWVGEVYLVVNKNHPSGPEPWRSSSLVEGDVLLTPSFI